MDLLDSVLGDKKIQAEATVYFDAKSLFLLFLALAGAGIAIVLVAKATGEVLKT